jgi:hypothetical protein
MKWAWHKHVIPSTHFGAWTCGHVVGHATTKPLRFSQLVHNKVFNTPQELSNGTLLVANNHMVVELCPCPQGQSQAPLTDTHPGKTWIFAVGLVGMGPKPKMAYHKSKTYIAGESVVRFGKFQRLGPVLAAQSGAKMQRVVYMHNGFVLGRNSSDQNSRK